MSFIPVFEIGIWNAWIFMIWLLIQNFGIGLLNKELYKKAGHQPDTQQSLKYKFISYISMPLWLLVTAYSIFLPLKIGTTFFTVGIAIFLLGIIINTCATINFWKTPINEPVTRGVYRFSRHPIYLGLLLIYLSVGIASASWVFLLLTAFSAILIGLSVADEEHYCLEKYGETYRKYMNRTPRWIGIPK